MKTELDYLLEVLSDTTSTTPLTVQGLFILVKEAKKRYQKDQDNEFISGPDW